MKVTIFLIPNYALENRKCKNKNGTYLISPEPVSGMLLVMVPINVFKIGLWWTVLNIPGLMGS